MSKDCVPNEYKNKAEEIMREMYKRGYHDDINDGNINNGTFNAKVKEAYNNGLYDAWEAAKKIVCPVKYGGIALGELRKMFGIAAYDDILQSYSAIKAVEKIKEYESHVTDTNVGEIETERNAKDLAEKICEQIAEEAIYAHIDKKWYFEKVVQYIKAESEGKNASCD